MKKRSMDEVFAAIGAAMSETQGRTLEQIDRSGDAASAAARKQVSVTLQDYALPSRGSRRCGVAVPLALERALHGPLAVPGALKAWLISQESDADEMSESERPRGQELDCRYRARAGLGNQGACRLAYSMV